MDAQSKSLFRAQAYHPGAYPCLLLRSGRPFDAFAFSPRFHLATPHRRKVLQARRRSRLLPIKITQNMMDQLGIKGSPTRTKRKRKSTKSRELR